MNIKSYLVKIWYKTPSKMRIFIWKNFRAPLNLLRHQTRDYVRFLKYNTYLSRFSTIRVEYSMLMFSHMLEKGFSLSKPRPFFGVDVIAYLIEETSIAIKTQGFSQYAIDNAVVVLKHYLDFHDTLTPPSNKEFETIQNIRQLIKTVDDMHTLSTGAPLVVLKNIQFSQDETAVMDKMIETRHSIRRFSSIAIPTDLIESAIKVAQRSPSSCNLQPTRVHVVQDTIKIQKLLEIQCGARGFAQEVNTLLVVSYEIGLQIGPRSRHQGYTDTGIFAGILMLALHSRNIGSCPLNWAQEIHSDKKLREHLDMPISHNIVMLIACGYIPKECEVATSRRRPCTDVITYLNY